MIILLIIYFVHIFLSNASQHLSHDIRPCACDPIPIELGGETELDEAYLRGWGKEAIAPGSARHGACLRHPGAGWPGSRLRRSGCLGSHAVAAHCQEGPSRKYGLHDKFGNFNGLMLCCYQHLKMVSSISPIPRISRAARLMTEGVRAILGD
jgi:hypothetical protein